MSHKALVWPLPADIIGQFDFLIDHILYPPGLPLLVVKNPFKLLAGIPVFLAHVVLVYGASFRICPCGDLKSLKSLFIDDNVYLHDFSRCRARYPGTSE